MPDSDFEIEVADRLRLRGYKVDLQVGVSTFRIDLGIRHPDHPERFLAGVECDGAMPIYSMWRCAMQARFPSACLPRRQSK
jgi:REase_MTES_1575